MTSKAATQAKWVTTLGGIRYSLGNLLGQGGQGKVFTVRGSPYAVKLLRHRSDQARQALQERLMMVGRLPLEDLAVARPLEPLRPPHLGYVMELFTGMVPLHTLIRPPKEGESLMRWYFDGGGLRRRLRLLAKVADIFARLHGRGLVYTDPSPQNLFVSADPTAHEVRLIDTDNVRVSADGGPALYTPGYGAPEVLSGARLPNSLSDAHAFAVIAFETLALIHPLKGGDRIENGAPELEEQALRGERPWIDDPNDDWNRSSLGIPRPFVLSRHLADAFAQAFGAGLKNPLARPGVSRWAEYLHRAADNTIICSGCGGSYYASHNTCPWCAEPRPTFVRAFCTLWDPERLASTDSGMAQAVDPGFVLDATGSMGKAHQIIDSMTLGERDPVIATDRFTLGTNRGEPQLHLHFAGESIQIEVLKPGTWILRTKDGRGDHSLVTGETIPLRDSRRDWRLHANTPDHLHRVIQFRLIPGASR